MTLTPLRLALVGVLSLLALTGCGGGGASGAASAQGGTAESLPGPAARAVAGSPLADGSKAVAAATLVEHKAVVENGDLVVRTPDPQQARDRVGVLLHRLHGSVDDEQTAYDKQGRVRDSQLVLRIPVASFATAMDQLEGLGTVVHSTSTAQDVTTEVIDVHQRLRTLRISLHDLNSFQRQAANIDQLLRFESAITQRRGEYQSLKAQRNHLVDQVTMSTITLDLSVPPAHTTATAHHTGFGTGLRHGWAALTGTVLVALTVVGAALPFAVLLALVGLPLWWGWRHLWHTRPTPAPVDGPPAE